MSIERLCILEGGFLGEQLKKREKAIGNYRSVEIVRFDLIDVLYSSGEVPEPLKECSVIIGHFPSYFEPETVKVILLRLKDWGIRIESIRVGVEGVGGNGEEIKKILQEEGISFNVR